MAEWPPLPDATGSGGPATSPLDLFAHVLAAGSSEAAAHRLAAALVTLFDLQRASVGRHDGGRTGLWASSDAALRRGGGELLALVIGAMDEAIEQARCVSAAAGGPPSPADLPDGAVCHEQRLLARFAQSAVASLPMGTQGEVFGAVCIERAGVPGFSTAELDRLDELLTLAGPVLHLKAGAEQPWHARAWQQLQGRWDDLRRPERRGHRRLIGAAALVLGVVATVPLELQVGGRARVEGVEQRVLVAPVDGFVKIAHVRPGDRVAAGAALLDLFDRDLQLEHDRLSSQLTQHENSYAAAMAKSDRVAAATGAAKLEEAQAQLALVDEQLARGRITAPFAGLVIQGDLTQSSGAPVRQGDALLTLARTEQFRVIIDVDEIDIARVQPGQDGQLTLSSLPWDRQALVIERVSPQAKAIDGRNVFEVQARLTELPDGLRPGLQGRADLVVGRMPLLWAWSRHALARIRVAYWAWLA